jgi:hypothetical protein
MIIPKIPLSRFLNDFENTRPSRMIELGLYFERVAEAGEDAEPLIKVTSTEGTLAVFDGMGGSGGQQYIDKRGRTRTGAYIASRLARMVVEKYFEGVAIGTFSDGDTAETGKKLRQMLTIAFNEKLIGLGAPPNRLVSKMIRFLPTTMAALRYRCCEDRDLKIETYWAGDSRTFLLTPETGLQQLTIDETKGDASSESSGDAPVSNCISASHAFEIRAGCQLVKIPAILLSATDGCFAYFPTPAHFEWVLLSSALDSKDEHEWKFKLNQKIAQVAGDDFSLALICLGWTRWDKILETFSARSKYLYSHHIKPIADIDTALLSLEESKRNALMQREAIKNESWASYRVAYHQLIHPGSKNAVAS